MSDETIPMEIFPTLDERQRGIAKNMAHAAVAVLRDNGLEPAPMSLDEHVHLRLLVEVSASWLLAAESPTVAKPVLERRSKHRDYDDEEIDERRQRERGRTLDTRSGGR